VAPSASDGVVAVDVMADDGSEALLLLPLPLLPLLPPPPLPPPPPPLLLLLLLLLLVVLVDGLRANLSRVSSPGR
jgi:hypothetical protein